MRVAVGADHRGFELKKKIVQIVTNAGHTCDDLGTYSNESVDYPEISKKVAEAVASGGFDRGILICDTGIGVCIAANKVKGIRAALCHNVFCACRARQHNDANVLCLAVENGIGAVEEVVKSFLTCEFEGGRHQRRVNQIKAMEG
ncbi:MAG: ribose 5-phosphate isomerase B [Dehalococcoidales bacterium]|nr:ribose 5-phosphate isomerase B [Dehalococcoidales bacterium]